MRKWKSVRTVALLLLFAFALTLFAGCSTSTTPTNPEDPTDPNPMPKEFVAKPFAFWGWEGADASVLKDMNVVMSDNEVVLSKTSYTFSECEFDILIGTNTESLFCYYDTEETRAVLEKLSNATDVIYLKSGLSHMDIHTVWLLYDIDGTYYFCRMTPAGRTVQLNSIWFAKHTE